MKQTTKRMVLTLVMSVLIILFAPIIQTKASGTGNPKINQEKEEEGVLELVHNPELHVYGASSITLEQLNLIQFNKVGYIINMCSLKFSPSKKSKLWSKLKLNQKVQYADYSKHHKIVRSGNKVFFINSKNISRRKLKTWDYEVSGDKCKTYESYKAIGTKGRSTQSKLQAQAITREDGVRTVDGRVCIAVGSHYKANIGQYVDIHLKNGTVIEAIIGDWKADCHTVNNHTLGLNHDAIEVIVDVHTLKKTSKVSGDMSDLCKAWDSKVTKIVKYDKNYFK